MAMRLAPADNCNTTATYKTDAWVTGHGQAWGNMVDGSTRGAVQHQAASWLVDEPNSRNHTAQAAVTYTTLHRVSGFGLHDH